MSALGRRGGCKHARLMQLCLEARKSPQSEESVRERAAEQLRHFVYERERAKTTGEQRDHALYTASQPGAPIDRLLATLRGHTSYAPTGKGLPAVSDAIPEPTEEQLLAELEADAEPSLMTPSEAGATATTDAAAPRILKCAFESADDLGLVVCTDSDDQVVIVRFAQLASGAFGPAVHTGEQLRAGDVLLRANGHGELAGCVANGRLRVPSSSTAAPGLRLEFTRATGRRTDGFDLGGRPKAKRAKFPARKAAEKTGAAAAPSPAPLLAGGSPAKKAKKKEPVKSRAKQPRTVRLGDFAPRGESETEQEAQARVRAGLTRLLSQRELPCETRAALDEELTEATYIP